MIRPPVPENEKKEPCSLGIIKTIAILGELTCIGIFAFMVMRYAFVDQEEGVEKDKAEAIKKFAERLMKIAQAEKRLKIVTYIMEKAKWKMPEELWFVSVCTLIFPFLEFLIFIFAFSCCMLCACCCGMRDYVRLKWTMVLLLKRAGYRWYFVVKAEAYWDVTVYFITVLPILFFVFYGWDRADDYDDEPEPCRNQVIIMQVPAMQPHMQMMPMQMVHHHYQQPAYIPAPPAPANPAPAAPAVGLAVAVHDAAQDHEYFRKLIQDLAKSLGIDPASRVVEKAIMFTNKKWDHHQKLRFNRCRREQFWTRNLTLTTDRLKGNVAG